MSEKIEWSNKDEALAYGNELFGFVYRCVYEMDGKEYDYIGKKTARIKKTSHMLKDGSKRENHVNFFRKRVNMGKRELKYRTQEQIQRGTTTIIKDMENYYVLSPQWHYYEGSAKNVPPEAKLISKEILEFAFHKQELSYLEMYHQFQNSVLERDNNFNGNIAGKYFSNIVRLSRKL